MKTISLGMKPSRGRAVVAAAVVASASLFAGAPAAAQQGGTLMPPAPGGAQTSQPSQLEDITAAPQPKVPKNYPVWVGYLVVFLMVAAIMGASLMPSKRSHQD